MTQVEIGQETVEQRQPPQVTGEEMGRHVSYEESSVRTRKVADPTIVESGFHYQRCGGGRRVLRGHRAD